MAKKKKRGRPKGSKNRLTGTAETIGTAFGNVAAKLDGWMAQRREIANELNAVIARAKGMLSSLEFPPLRRGPVRPAAALGAAAPTDRTRKRRKMSPEARAKISAAQKARWAKQKAKAPKGAKRAKKAGGTDVGNG